MALPSERIRVVDLTIWLQGSLTPGALADMGAAPAAARPAETEVGHRWL